MTIDQEVELLKKIVRAIRREAAWRVYGDPAGVDALLAQFDRDEAEKKGEA